MLLISTVSKWSTWVLTHAHPDHADGSRTVLPVPYATDATREAIDRYPVDDRRTVRPRVPIVVRGIRFEALTVEHPLRAPAVGYRITGGRAKEGVPRAIITDCGSQIVTKDERVLGAPLRRPAAEHGVHAIFAHDGLEVVLR